VVQLLAPNLACDRHRRAPRTFTGTDSDWPGWPADGQFRSHVACLMGKKPRCGARLEWPCLPPSSDFAHQAGRWLASVELSHGYHQYLFLVDGERVLDPNAAGKARNDRNEPVSLRAIS
jgi:hypothetical protein